MQVRACPLDARSPALRSRIHVADEGTEMRPAGGVQAEGTSDGVGHGRRGNDLPPLFQPRVVVARHPGEQRHFLTAKARHAPDPAVGRKPGLLRADPGTSPPEKVRQLRIHILHTHSIPRLSAESASLPGPLSPTLSDAGTRIGSGDPGPAASGQEPAELQLGKVGADPDGAGVLKFPEQAFTCAAREGRVDVADRAPGGLVELYGADDGPRCRPAPQGPGRGSIRVRAPPTADLVCGCHGVLADVVG